MIISALDGIPPARQTLLLLASQERRLRHWLSPEPQRQVFPVRASGKGRAFSTNNRKLRVSLRSRWKHISESRAQKPQDLASRVCILPFNDVGAAIKALSWSGKAAMPAQDNRFRNLLLGSLLFDK